MHDLLRSKYLSLLAFYFLFKSTQQQITSQKLTPFSKKNTAHLFSAFGRGSASRTSILGGGRGGYVLQHASQGMRGVSGRQERRQQVQDAFLVGEAAFR